MQKSIQRFTCLIGLILLSGCGLTDNQIIKTQSFGTATEQIGTLGETEFVTLRNGIIQMNEELIAIKGVKVLANKALDRPTYIEPTAQRIAASKALKIYGQLLVSLVNEDRSTNLQEAANALVANTSAAIGNDLNGQRDLISNIIVGFGSVWVDEEKANALAAIVPAYQGAVDSLANSLLKDFAINDDASANEVNDDDNSETALGYLQAYQTTAKRLKRAAAKLLNAYEPHSILERERAAHAFTVAEMAIIRATELNKKAQEAIGELKTANAALVQVIKNPDYNADDIKGYAKKIQELVNMYQLLIN